MKLLTVSRYKARAFAWRGPEEKVITCTLQCLVAKGKKNTLRGNSRGRRHNWDAKEAWEWQKEPGFLSFIFPRVRSAGEEKWRHCF